MSVGRLAARALIGGLFIGHGSQKVFGWFGGPGRAGAEAMMESIDMRPGRLHVTAAGITEIGAGTMLAAGLGTPLAAAGLTGVMTTAIKKIHLASGPWAANGGWEYNAVLIAAVIALAETGPGSLSLDEALGIELNGPVVALAALGLGVAAAAVTMEAGRRGKPTAALAADGSAATAHGDTAGDPATSGA